MAKLLIKVKKAVWQKSGMPSFVGSNDVPGNCLADLRIANNELSTWYITDDRSNLRRVLTALAANSEFVSNIDYLIFDYSVVAELGLEIRKTVGRTPDRHANREWHHDLVNLSGRNVLRLAVAMFHNSDLGREFPRTVSAWIREATERHEIDISLLNAKLVPKVLAGTHEGTRSRFVRMCKKVYFSAREAWSEFRQG